MNSKIKMYFKTCWFKAVMPPFPLEKGDDGEVH